MRFRWLSATAAPLVSLLCVLSLTACDKAEAPEITPVPTAAPSATAVAPAIIIESPGDGDTVGVPIKVRGTASVFEATLLVAVKDSRGNTLCQVVATASEGAPGRGDYAAEFAFTPPSTSMKGRVEAFTQSPKDGSVQDLVSVPVTIAAEQPLIVLTSPLCNQDVRSPLLVEGTASVFEGALVMVVKDSAGKELARVPAQASLAAPERGSFSQEVTFQPPAGPQPGTVEAYSGDPKDGSIINVFSVPVVLAP